MVPLSRCLFQVNVAFDKKLVDQTLLNFHPLTNEATTAISWADLTKFLEATGHGFKVVDFDA